MTIPELSQMLTQGHAAAESARDDGNGLSPDVKRERHFNAVLSKIDSACLSEKVLAFPIEHFLAISDSCNLECVFCPRQAFFGPRLEDGLLPYEEFEEKIIPLVKVVSNLVGLYGLGEPFFHSRFFDFVRMSREAGAQTMTNCHGMSLKPKLNEQILESGLDQLNVSIDGATTETFNYLRTNADFETVKANIHDLVKRRDDANLKNPRLVIATMINNINLPEVPDIVRLAKDLGAGRIDFSDTVVCESEDLQHSVSGTPQMTEQIQRALDIGKELDIVVGYTVQKPFPWRPLRPDELEPQPIACDYLWNIWLTGKEGDVQPCCFIDWEMGNLWKDDPKDILNSPKARKLRRSLIDGNPPRECRGCGSAHPLTPEFQRNKLREAREMLSDPKLTEEQRTELTKILDEREKMIGAQREEVGTGSQT